MAPLLDEPIKILLFEDNQHDAKLVENYLNTSNIAASIKQVSRLTEGLEELSSKTFDVLLIDLSLPDSRGLPTLVSICSKIRYEPIIVLTGTEEEALSLEALKIGAQDYLEKDDLTPDKLCRSIRYSIERSKLLMMSASHAEETRKRERTLQEVFDANSEAMLILDKNFAIKSLNSAAAHLLDANQQTLIGETFPFHFRNNERTEIEIPAAGDQTCTVELDSTKLSWGDEQIYLLVLRDISHLRETQVQIKAQESYFRQVIDSIAEVVITTDKNGIILHYNKFFEHIFSINNDPVIGRFIGDVISAWSIDKTPLLSNFPHSFINQQTGEPLPETDALIESQDQPPKKVSIKLHSIKSHEDRSQTHYIAIFRSLNKEARSEEDAFQAEKLHSISLLAGGIAHDFNNMLTAILGNISVVTHGLKPDDPNAARLLASEKAAFQAKRLTQQLLTFSKGGSPILEATTIDQLVEDCAEFILRGSNVKCSVKKSGTIWAVNADKGQIAQVVNNLLINADQAMPNGGVIELKISNLSVKRKGQLNLDPADYVCVSIKDYGIGIEPSDINRIFDPYFTTKKSGNGLGLASSYSIIKSHQGQLTVESTPGKGARFDVYLPRSSTTILVEEPKADYGTKIYKGKGRILIMDDMEAMMHVAGEIVSILGYEVAFSTNGKEAIRAYKQAKESGKGFDAVVFDLTVPGGMGGEEACRQLRQYDPQLKAIASSGYSTSNIMSDHQNSPFQAVLPKPYRIKEMSVALHNLLK